MEGDFARISLPRSHGDVLRDLLIEERAGTVVEIGLAYGASALAIGEALRSATAPWHVIIDPFQTRTSTAPAGMSSAKLVSSRPAS